MQYSQKNLLLKKFWKIWSVDYLNSLPKLVPAFDDKGFLTKGSLVLVQDENLPRIRWPVGTVIEVYPGLDGKIRSAKVKTARSVIERPVQRLCSLESNRNLQSDEEAPSDKGVNPGVLSENPVSQAEKQ